MQKNSSERRNTILKAALVEFSEQGVGGARLQTIADHSGVTKAMIHYYFDTKQQLFNEVFQEAYGVVMAGLLDILETDKPLFEKIEVFVDTAIERFQQQPGLVNFLLNALNRNPDITVSLMRELMDYDDTTFKYQLEDAASKYEIAPVDSRHVVMNMMALCMFPYAGRQFMNELLNLESEEAYMELLEQRKGLATDTIINWLAS